MSVRLYIKDTVSGTEHEYGTNVHDSLVLWPDGSLHYENIQNGDGTAGGGYIFLTDDFISEDGEAFKTVDIGGVEMGVGCEKCKNRVWYRRWLCGGCKRRQCKADRFVLDVDAAVDEILW